MSLNVGSITVASHCKTAMTIVIDLLSHFASAHVCRLCCPIALFVICVFPIIIVKPRDEKCIRLAHMLSSTEKLRLCWVPDPLNPPLALLIEDKNSAWINWYLFCAWKSVSLGEQLSMFRNSDVFLHLPFNIQSFDLERAQKSSAMSFSLSLIGILDTSSPLIWKGTKMLPSPKFVSLLSVFLPFFPREITLFCFNL